MQMDLLANFSKWPFWIDCASVVVIAVGVAKAFEWFDGLVSDESWIALWYYLADVPSDERIDSWGTVFPKLIDRVFGKKALSLSFILRSSIASIIAVYVVAFLRHLALDSHEGLASLPVKYYATFICGSIANVIPDYLSLLVTRTIVRVLAKNPTPYQVCLALVNDTVITVVIAEAAIYVLMALIVGAISLVAHGSLILLTDMLHSMSFIAFEFIAFKSSFYSSFLSIFFFSAFFTSFWLWLYALSIFFIKAAHKIRPLWLKVLPYLDIEKKPMQAIGRIAGIMAGVGYAVVLGIVWLVHRGH